MTGSKAGRIARRILIGYGPDESAQDALALGDLLARTTGAELVVASVYVVEPAMSDEYRLTCRQEAEQRVDASLRQLAAAGRPSRGIAHASRSVTHGLSDLALEEDAELIVLGSRHTAPLGKLLSGAVTERLFGMAPCSVAVSPQGFAGHVPERFGRVGIGYDGSAEARAALAEGTRLAGAAAAELRVLVVHDSSAAHSLDPAEDEHLERERLEEAHALLDEALDIVGTRELSSGDVVSGEPARALAEATASDALDLLVIGSRGYGPFHGVVSRSVSSYLARNTACPLVVVSRAQAPELAEGRAGAVATPPADPSSRR